MPTPAQVRASLPALAGLDDDQLVDAVHQLYFGNESRDQVAARMGIAPPPPPPAAAPGLGGRAKDLGISLLKGAVDIPEAAVGLADIPTGGRVGKFLANDGGAIGFRPAEAKAFLDNGYSDAQKAAFQKVNDARGFMNTAAAVATNPTVILQGAAESAPSMLAGGAVSRAALLARPAMSGALAGALGEGTVAAGQQVEQTREETPGGLLTPEQVALTAGSGLIDAALSFGGSKAAHAMGATNVATWLTGKSDVLPGVSRLRQVLAGGGEEGLQEFLQSAQEQVLQNKAEGKPLDDGLDQAAILGLTTGAAMGGGANLIHSTAHAVPATPPESPGDVLRASAPPVVGPTSRAAATAVEAGAQELDANPAAHAAPAGPVGMIPEIDPAHEQGVLDHANTRSAQLAEAEKGVKEQTIPPATEDGEPTIIPAVAPRHLTPTEKLEQEFLNTHGGDAQAVAHHYENLIPNIQRKLTESATQVATPEALAAVQPDNVMRAGDIGPGTGVPYPTRGPANLALSRMGEDAANHSVVPVDGGHVIRPNEAPVALPPAADETPTVTAPDGSQRATFESAAAANQYLKQARKTQGVQGTGVKPVQLPAGHWVLATREERAHIESLAAQVSTAPAAPVETQGVSNGNEVQGQVGRQQEKGLLNEPGAEWQAFPPESGTLGIPRSEMPQVAAEHRGALVNFLKARGVTSEPAAPVDARTLKATQAEFSPAKVEKARNYEGGQRSILISSDGHVVDGHHQAIAADQGPVSAIRLNAPIRDLLPLVHEFPSATVDGKAVEPAKPGRERRMRNGELEGHNGLTPSEARANSIASNASDIAHIIHEESTTDDFDPKEIPEGVRQWQWPAGMTENEKFAETIAAVMKRPQFRRKQGVLSELRKAAAPAVAKTPRKVKTPALNDLSRSTAPQRGTEDQARAAGYTMKAYRGVNADKPFNDTGTTWLTTSKSVAESYASEVMGYDNPGVIEVMVNPKDLPRHDASRLSDEQRAAMEADDFGNPQAVGIYDRSDDHPLGGSAGNVTVIHAPKSAVFVIDNGTTLSDRSRIGTPAVMDKLAAQGYERANVPAVRVAQRLNGMLDEHSRGQMSDMELIARVDQLARDAAAASNTKQANRMTGERQTGPDIVREKILAAMRRGEIDRETGEFAQWLINRDAHLTEGLGISVRTAGEGNRGSAGQYNGAARIMTLFKGQANDGTAVHEILHHTERMMPAGIQAAIHKEWAKRLATAIAQAEPGSPRAKALAAILEAVANPGEKAQSVVHDAFAANGPLDYDQDYQLVNPSEFWAVNATSLLQGQFHAQTWLGRARTWLNGMVQAVKSILGLQSDHAVLRGIQSVIDGDGSEQSRRMLSENATHLANQPDVNSGRRAVLKAMAGSAGVAAGLRGLSVSMAGNGAEDVPLVKATGAPKPGASTPIPTPAAITLHDLQRPTLEAISNLSLPFGRQVNDYLGGTPGKVSWWHKSFGTPYDLAQRHPHTFGKVFNSLQAFIGDVSRFANEAADLAPTLLPKLEGFKSIFTKSAISVTDRDAIAPATFSNTTWMRDADGNLVKLTPDQQDAQSAHDEAVNEVQARNLARATQFANYTPEQKRAHLLQNRVVTPEVMRMWDGRTLDEYGKMLSTAFTNAITEAEPTAPEGIKPGVVFSDDELRQHHNLTPDQIGMYREFRASIDQSLNRTHSIQMMRLVGDDVTPEVRAQVLAAPDAQGAAKVLTDHLKAIETPERAETLASTAKEVDKLAAQAKDLIDRGYAPYMRFGTWALDVTDPTTKKRLFFNLYESEPEMKRAMRHLKESRAFNGMTFETGTTSQEKYKLFAQMSPDTVALFGDMIGLSSTGDAASDLAFQEFLKRAKSANSAMKHLIHRTGVDGFSLDAGRVLAGFTYSNGRLSSNGLHSGEVARHFNAIPKGEGQIIDQAYKLMTHVQNPSEGGQAIKALLFTQYLGGSVASAFVNATQPFMTTMPFLSQYGGIASANKHMAQALPLIRKIAKVGKTGNAALDAALHEYRDRVEPQEVHQLMAQGRGRAALHSGDGTRGGDAAALAHNVMSRIGMAWGKVFGVAEQLNRRLTFIAAFNQAVENGVSDPGAHAAKVVDETQFVMNKGNKPVAARGAVGGILMTFKTYSISYLEMMQRLATAGTPGSPERAAGRRAFLYAIGAMMMMAGADGLPFIEDIDDVIDGALQRLGYNFHSKVAREAFFKNLFGDDMGKVLTKGLSGLPGAPLDVSGRLGMANLIPGTGLLVDKVDHTSDLMELGGPAADTAKRFGSAAVALAQGKVGDAVTSAAPKALANMIQAASMWQSGMYKDQSGKKVIDTDFADGLSKFIGFQPNDVSSVQNANFAVTQTIAENRLKQTQIADAMAKARFEHDEDAMAAAQADLASWNAKNPDTPIRIKPADIRTRVKNMGMTKEQRTIKAAPAGIRETVRERLASAGQ